MDKQNLESVLAQLTENKISDEDQLKIKEILSQYNIEKNTTTDDNHIVEESLLEEGLELPQDEWEDPSDFEFLSEDTNEINTVVAEEELVTPIVEPSKPQQTLKADENGQYELQLENNSQLELDLITIPDVKEQPKENMSSIQVEEHIEPEIPKLDESKLESRKEPVLSLDSMETVEANTVSLDSPILPPKNERFKNFENMAKNAIGKVHNLFNFQDNNGKIDWYGTGKKSVIILKNIKDIAFDNLIVNRLKSMIVKKYTNSKLGIKTHQIADTLTVNLMSREDRYNREFKNAISLLGYDVKELIKPTNNPMLTLQEVSDNVNKNLKEKLGLELNNSGYTSNFIKTLNEDQKAQFIQTVVWPKLTEMMSESMKLFEALKDIKSKNVLYKEIAQAAKKNNMEEDLFATMLLKSPEILKEKGIKEVDSLLLKKKEIESVYFKNEELFGKNFVMIQNLVKASASIQKMVTESNLSKEYKQKILTDMKKTVIKSDSKDYKKKVLFETVQESISSSLQDTDFIKSLREVNESILKMRKNQNKEKINKPKM